MGKTIFYGIVVLCNLLVVGWVRGQDDLYCRGKQRPIDISESTKGYNYPYTVMVTSIKPMKRYVCSGTVLNRLWIISIAEFVSEKAGVTYAIAGANRTVLPYNFRTPLYPVEFVEIMPEYHKSPHIAKYNIVLLKLFETSSEIIDPIIHLHVRPGYIPDTVSKLETAYWKRDGKGGYTKQRIYWCPKPAEFSKKCMFKTIPYICLSTTLGPFDLKDPNKERYPCTLSAATRGTALALGNQVFGIILGIQYPKSANHLHCGSWMDQEYVYYVFLHLSTVISSETPENNDVAMWIDKTLKKHAPIPDRPIWTGPTELPLITIDGQPTRPLPTRRPKNVYYLGFCELNKDERPLSLRYFNLLLLVFIILLL